MSDNIAARMAAQNAEFDAARELSKQMRRIELTPVVDDDYPSVRFDYERAVRGFLDAARANGRIAVSEKGDWIPCSEVMPKPMQEVLGYEQGEHNAVLVVQLRPGGNDGWWCGPLTIHGITHWMPLPEAPK